MKNLFLKTVSISALIGVGNLALAQTVSAQESDDTDRDASQLEEVIVTAERRESTLLAAPIAVSAFDEIEMERRQTFNVVDIVNNVPNLVGSNNIGQNTATTVFLRGVGTTESIVTVDTALGFYVDDVYIGRQGVNNFSLYDVERVEVLRGPQGTLHGRNTNAGAIKVITRKPDETPAASIQGSYGRFNRWELKASGNVPLSDNLFFRGTVMTQQVDGNTLNTTLDKMVNDQEYFGFRGALRYVASDSFEATLTGDYSKSDANGLYAVDILGAVRPTTGDLFEVVSGTDSQNIGRAYGVNLTMDWDINDNVSVQSITAFRNTYQKWNLDLTDQVVPIFTLYTINDSNQFSQEIKFNGTFGDGKLEWVAGAFYFKEDSISFIGDDINLWIAPGILDFRVPLPFFGRDYDMETKSLAAFAEINYHITDALSLVAGGRYTKDDKALVINQTLGGTPGYVNNGPIQGYNNASIEAAGTPTTLKFTEFTPKIGVKYDVNDDLNMYVMYTQGFKSGGWAARTNDAAEVQDFAPEFINNYEIGLKSNLFNKRARLNLVAFYYDYQDLFNTGSGDDGNFIVATNDAKVWGMEAEFTGRLNENLDIFMTMGLQDGKHVNLDPQLAGTVIGPVLQRLPKFTSHIGFSYTRPVTDEWDLRINADYNHQDDHHTNLQNTDLVKSGSVDRINASVGMGSEKYEVKLSCRNCFDDRYVTQSLDFSGLGFVVVYPGEPATWMISFKARM